MQMEATQPEKIYVALGHNWIDGYNTLAWALSKWYSQQISIVILHVKYNTSKHLLTLLGKFPEGIACDVKLETMRKYEQDIIDKLLSKYIALCDNVPAEILEIEKFDEPIQKRTIDLIYGLGITKLVMGFSFMKASLKQKDAINALFYVHKNKPAFCELFVVCDGKEVFIREKNDEVVMEDENGVTVARMKKDKICIIDCLERMFDKTPDSQRRSSFGSTSSANLESPLNQNQWEFYLQEIENYLQELLSLNLEEEGSYMEENDISPVSPAVEPYVIKNPSSSSDNTRAAEKYEILKDKLNKAYNIIQMKRKEAKKNLERHEKAEWAIWLCSRREEELESLIKEEVTAREELKKELDANKEQLDEISVEVEESKKRLSSLTELQSELVNKLHMSTLEVSQAESQVDKAMAEMEGMLRDIEELRRQRDVVNKRVVFLKQIDGTRMSAKGGAIEKGYCGFREYKEEEIIMATHNFWDQLRLRSGGGWSNVYRGRINHSTVAIKMLNSVPGLSQADFLAKVRLLGGIRQPHLVAMLGFCSEPKCIVLEYMHNGSLGDILFCRRRSQALRWQDRIRIAIEACSGLGFLNAAQPRPTIHCQISPSTILLDSNLVAKITGFGLNGCNEECNVESEIKDIGALLMQLLTGRRNWMAMDKESFLDATGVKWPLDVATELEDLAMRCMSMNNGPNEDMMSIARVVEELNEIRGKGDSIAASPRDGWRTTGGLNGQDSIDVPLS